MTAPATDEFLVHAAANGDTAAFGDLLQRHYPTLLSVCMHITRDAALAQDCAQDACVIALTRLLQLRSGMFFGPWLIGIGRHTCHRALRTSAARQAEHIPMEAEDELVDERALSPMSCVAMSDLSRSVRVVVDN